MGRGPWWRPSTAPHPDSSERATRRIPQEDAKLPEGAAGCLAPRGSPWRTRSARIVPECVERNAFTTVTKEGFEVGRGATDRKAIFGTDQLAAWPCSHRTRVSPLHVFVAGAVRAPGGTKAPGTQSRQVRG